MAEPRAHGDGGRSETAPSTGGTSQNSQNTAHVSVSNASPRVEHTHSRTRTEQVRDVDDMDARGVPSRTNLQTESAAQGTMKWKNRLDFKLSVISSEKPPFGWCYRCLTRHPYPDRDGTTYHTMSVRESLPVHEAIARGERPRIDAWAGLRRPAIESAREQHEQAIEPAESPFMSSDWVKHVLKSVTNDATPEQTVEGLCILLRREEEAKATHGSDYPGNIQLPEDAQQAYEQHIVGKGWQEAVEDLCDLQEHEYKRLASHARTQKQEMQTLQPIGRPRKRKAPSDASDQNTDRNVRIRSAASQAMYQVRGARRTSAPQNEEHSSKPKKASSKPSEEMAARPEVSGNDTVEDAA